MSASKTYNALLHKTKVHPYTLANTVSTDGFASKSESGPAQCKASGLGLTSVYFLMPELEV